MPLETNDYRALLLSIAQDLTSRNLEEMKYACSNIPDGVLEKITAPHQLFTELENRSLLTEIDVDFLARLLLNVGRQELARKLLGMNAPKVFKRSCSMVCGKLPGKVPHFFGRVPICDKVIASLRSFNNHLVTITGPPGYGKSAVAISVGHQLTEEMDHHVYYTSTRGVLSIESVAFQMLYSFGIVAGADPVAQTHHYLESIHNETLLIFDNVEDLLQPKLKDKFLHFIQFIGERAAHVKMIITSRTALNFYSFNMENVLLPAFTNSQAAQLIHIFTPQEISHSHAEKLGQLCKGVPLLIRAVASLLAQDVDPCLLVAEFERSPGTTLRSLCFEGMPPEFDMYPCLEVCFDRLTTEEQHHLVALSVFPSSFNIHDASCVLRNVNDLQRQLIVKKLVDNSFVRPDTEGKRFYAVHSIVQVFCQEITKERQVLKELYSRAMNHFNMYYLSMLHDLNEQFYQNAEKLRAAMTSFECKKNNIFLALENSLKEEKLVNYAADLLNSSYRFFTVRLSMDEFRSWYHKLENYFDKNGDKKRYTNSLVSLGFHQFWVMCMCRRPCPTATKLFEKAYKNFKELQITNTEPYAECLSKLARAYAYDSDQLDEPIAMVKEAKAVVESLEGNLLSRLSVMNDYAATYSFHKDHKKAIEFRENFLPKAKEHLGDHPGLGICYDELGSSYEELGNTTKSIECRKEAIRIFEGFLGDHKFTATSYVGLGTTLKSEAKYEEALDALQKAFEIQRKTIGPHAETITTSEEIEKVLTQLDRTAEAKEWAKKTQKLIGNQERLEKELKNLQM